MRTLPFLIGGLAVALACVSIGLAQDRPSQGKPGQDTPPPARPTPDKPGQDKPGQDKPGRDKPKDKQNAPSSVSVQVLGIRATRSNSDVSPELRALADKLKRQFSFTGLKLEKRLSGTAAMDKAFSGALSGGYSVNVTPKSADGKRVQLQVEVLQDGKSKSSITATSTAGEFVPYIFPLPGGDSLIICVSAR